MNNTSSDDILLLKQRLAEQEALNRALLEKLADREREIDHLQAQLHKLRRMNFGSRSEKVSRLIVQMEADLKALQKENDTLTGRVDDPAVQRPLRQTRTRKPFPESLPRDEKRMLPAGSCCPECGGSLSYLGAGFNELYRNGQITEAACWAHARRKIHDVHVRTPSALTEEALKRIGELYAIEAEIRGMPVSVSHEPPAFLCGAQFQIKKYPACTVLPANITDESRYYLMEIHRGKEYGRSGCSRGVTAGRADDECGCNGGLRRPGTGRFGFCDHQRPDSDVNLQCYYADGIEF